MNLWFYPPPLKRHPVATRPSPSVAVIRAAYLKLVWRRAYWHQRIRLYLAVLTWPLWSLLRAIRYTASLGGRVRRETGKGRLRQFREQLDLAWRSMIPPANYYMFELYLDA